jgi:DNA-directed RNA polymerase subunit RPC12/RpoP
MPKTVSEKVKNRILELFKKNNAELLSFEKGRIVKYRCSCGNESQTCTNNIRETWKGCIKCLNTKRNNKNDYEFARKLWEENGEILPKQEYKDNKTKLYYNCSNCKKQAHMSLSEFSRGRRCEHCSKQRASKTNLEKYGVENVFQSEEIKQRIKDTNLEKHGVDHHMKVKEILQKTMDTNMKKYGIEFAFHSKESFDKIHETCVKRYGVEYPLQCEHIREKVIETCRQNLGVDYPFQSEKIRKKSRETCLDKYGVEHPLQYEEFFNKMVMSGYSLKEYIFPSGRKEYCQGYEPRCFDYLLSIGYEENDIEVGYKNRESIWYSNPANEGKMCRYYPDGFIKSENTVIEVKSTWTYEKDLEKNRSKFNSVVESGMNVNVYIFNKYKLVRTEQYSSDMIFSIIE